MKIPEDKIRYIDRPDIPETFADSIHLTVFDGQNGRIELCVTRMDSPDPPTAQSARRYPVCRLVLSPEVMFNLFNQLQGIVNVLEKDGILKKLPIEVKKSGPSS